MSQLSTQERLYKYQVYCNTEGGYQDDWRTEADGPPTGCPNDPTHTWATPYYLQGWIDPTLTTIKEEDIETGGNFVTETLEVSAGANSTGSTTISYPFNVSVLAIEFDSEEIHRGDSLSLLVGKDTPIGTVTANTALPVTFTNVDTYQPNDNVEHSGAFYTCAVTTSSTPTTSNADWLYGYTFPVSSTVTLNTKVGYKLKVDNENVGRVIGVGSDSIRTEFAASTSLDAGDIVTQSVYKVDNYKLNKPKVHTVGASKIGASAVPAFTPITVEYHNQSLTDAKEIVGKVEYLY